MLFLSPIATGEKQVQKDRKYAQSAQLLREAAAGLPTEQHYLQGLG